MFRIFGSRSSDKPVRPRRWKRWLLVSTILVMVFLGFLPTIIAKSFLLNLIVSKAASDLQGTVSVGDASIGWFSSIELRNIQIKDPAGNIVVEIPQIKGSKSLLSLLGNQNDLGEFRIVNPSIYLVASEKGTNLEEILAPYLAAKPHEPKKSTSPKSMRLICDSGSVQIRDLVSKSEWSMDSIHAQMESGLQAETPLTVSVEGAIHKQDKAGSVRLTLKQDSNGIRSGELLSKQFPLEVIPPLIRRIDPSIQMTGTLDSNLHFSSSNPDSIQLMGSLQGSEVVFSDDSLHGDSIRFQSFNFPCNLQIDAEQVRVQQFDLNSDLGKISAKGHFLFSNRLNSIANLNDSFVEWDVDIAKLATMLSKTIRLHPGTEITSGRINGRLQTVKEKGSFVWKGNVNTSDLQGKSKGQAVAWNQPIGIDFVVKQSGESFPILEKLNCKSDFLTINGSGSNEQIQLHANVDLTRLTNQLSQFVDLGSFGMSGEVVATLTGSKAKDDRYQLKGNLDLKQFQLRDRTSKLDERLVQIAINVAAKVPEQGPITYIGGGVTFQSENDGMGLYIVEPMDESCSNGAVRVIARGDLLRWHTRLKSWVPPLREIHTSGPMDVTTLIKFTPQMIQINNFEGKFGTSPDMVFHGHGVRIQESNLVMKTSGTWNKAKSQLDLKQTEFTSASTSVKFPSLIAGTNSQGQFSLLAEGTVSGDLARVQEWLQNGSRLQSEPLRGGVSGTLNLKILSGTMDAQLDLNGNAIVLGNPQSPRWREQKLHLAGRVQYNPETDHLSVEQMTFEGTGLSVTAKGKLAHLRTSQEVSLHGELGYDMEKLEPQFRATLGNQLKVSGNGKKPFHLEGSLTSGAPRFDTSFARLDGELGLGWESVKFFGSEVGTANIKTQLHNGWLRILPLETTINQGKLKLDSAIRIEPGPSELVVNRGSGIDHIKLTPQVCDNALGYIAPILAKATDINGELSLTFDGGKLPLSAMEKGDIGGKMILHQVKVTGGPLIRELAIVLNSQAILNLANNQSVPFRMVNGRVYHENLKLTFPEITITTSGSVGIDGTLDLIAEMPIPPKWLGKTPLTPALAKQTIRLPINGTISQPKLNQQALKNAFAQIAKETSKDFLKEELEKNLQKLFPKR